MQKCGLNFYHFDFPLDLLDNVLSLLTVDRRSRFLISDAAFILNFFYNVFFFGRLLTQQGVDALAETVVFELFEHFLVGIKKVFRVFYHVFLNFFPDIDGGGRFFDVIGTLKINEIFFVKFIFIFKNSKSVLRFYL